jgi:glycosidase
MPRETPTYETTTQTTINRLHNSASDRSPSSSHEPARAMNHKTSFRAVIGSLACAVLLGQYALKAEDTAQSPARISPGWLRDGVLYEIFPRDFSAAGNLNAVTARLDELADLGVTVLWTMPIHPIGEKARKGEYGSPYSIKDYYAVDPNYGTVDDYKRLVAEAHKRHLKVIMDEAVDHTSWDSVVMSHPEFYKHDAQGNIISPKPEWADVAGLNYDNPQLREYVIAMMKYWVQTCDVDGFRCDVAWGVPRDFWETARAQLETVKPDIMMLAEASDPGLLVKAFDIDYDWSLMHTVNNVIMSDAPASSVQGSWESTQQQFPRGSLHMRVTDDHDEARAVSRYGVRGALAASALMFTLDGVPVLYNGMEVGDATESGDPALFAKLPIFWTPKDRPPLRQIYHGLIELRKNYATFRTGQVVWVGNSDANDVVTFKRADNQNEFVVAINFSNRPVKDVVAIENADTYRPVAIDGMTPAPNQDFPAMHLGGFEWRIYQRISPPMQGNVVGPVTLKTSP